MPTFQGSGFSIELPDDSADASAYTFLLSTPPNASLSPFITIQTERLQADDLESHVQALHTTLQKDLEDFRVLQFRAGRHAGIDVVLTTVEWGSQAARISQTQAFYLVEGEKYHKVFTLKGTDLAANFGNSQPVFNNTFRTFMPNDGQLLAEIS
jgi:hypothetical protein